MKNLRHKDILYKEGKDIPPSGYNKQSVELFAETLINEFKFKINDSLDKIINKLGGKIHNTAIYETDEPGSICVHKENEFDIITESMATAARTRFTIAHELGHYFLHSKQGEIPIVAYRLGTGILEWEANWFAASLLMPRDTFCNAHKKNPNTVFLANKFGLSFSAIEVRKESLGLN